MKNRPEISIIVPVYNAEKYLPKCIDTILAQTFSDFELILVDDGSKDNSGKICDDYAQKDPRIKVIHKKNGGASTARKTGVDAAGGRYIGWVDADDYIAEDMFSTLYSVAKEYDADITECQYIMKRGSVERKSGRDEPLVYGEGDFILKQFFSSKMKSSFCVKLYKAELYDDVEFPTRQYHVDTYVNMRFALKPLKYVRIPEAKYFYIMRDNSNITTYNAKLMREAIYKYEDTMSLVPTVESELAKKFLREDAVRRLMGRYFEITVNSDINDQNVYNHIIRKKLGPSLNNYLIKSNIPLKTKISLFLLLHNKKNLQQRLHKLFGNR